jgi:hypothetical protein
VSQFTPLIKHKTNELFTTRLEVIQAGIFLGVIKCQNLRAAEWQAPPLHTKPLVERLLPQPVVQRLLLSWSCL